MEDDKGKTVWDEHATKVFIHACVEQIYKKERSGSTFTQKGWKAITAIFNETTGREFGKKQFRNRLDVLKKELRTWDALNKETGVGRDPVTNAITASSKWWTQKIRANSAYRKFRHAPLQLESELRLIFKDVVATGEQIYSPSYVQLQLQPSMHEVDHNDVYIPTIDKQEGLGDNEDELFGTNLAISTGITGEMGSIGITNITPPAVASGSGSQGKRKRVEGQAKNKRHKIPTSQQIEDAVSKMTNSSEVRTETLKDIRESCVKDILNDLISLDVVKDDVAFRVRCIDLLQDKTARETYVSLRHMPTYLIEWLQYTVSKKNPT